jgi:hypothetical protein
VVENLNPTRGDGSRNVLMDLGICRHGARSMNRGGTDAVVRDCTRVVVAARMTRVDTCHDNAATNDESYSQGQDRQERSTSHTLKDMDGSCALSD